MILQCILNHASQHPDIPKAFFSYNTQQFQQTKVREALKSVGITYFNDIQHLNGWLNQYVIDN